MSDFVGFEMVGLEELTKKLRNIPPEAADEGVNASNTYLVNVLRGYPPQKHITIAQAGGWKSDKQRRWFFAALGRGEINVPYKRTQNLADNWKVIGTGRTSFIANETSYAHWVIPEKSRDQSNMHRLIGWKGLDVIIPERLQTIITKFDAGVKKAIKKLGL